MTIGRTIRRAGMALAVFVVGWLVFWSWDYTREFDTTLSAHLRVRELQRVERSAFTLAGHAVPVIALPVPSVDTQVLQQSILQGDRVLWRGTHWDAPSEVTPDPVDIRAYDSVFALRRPARMFVSPDEHYVALQSRYNSTPVRVFDVLTSRMLAIPIPDSALKRSDFGYPLRFHGWSSDSRRLYLRTHEGMDSRNLSSVWFREIWIVDPASGRATQAARCVADQHVYETTGPYDWSRTPCADGVRP